MKTYHILTCRDSLSSLKPLKVVLLPPFAYSFQHTVNLYTIRWYCVALLLWLVKTSSYPFMVYVVIYLCMLLVDSLGLICKLCCENSKCFIQIKAQVCWAHYSNGGGEKSQINAIVINFYIYMISFFEKLPFRAVFLSPFATVLTITVATTIASSMTDILGTVFQCSTSHVVLTLE